MVIASSVPIVFSAGADIKAFTQMDEAGGEELIHTAHALLRDFGQSRVATVAAVNAIAFGGGCELAMACDVRIAAEAAVFGQPEIKLGIIPGFGGTQRLPRLVGPNKALEMNLIGDAILAGEALETGLVNRVVPDHELFETALMWGRKLAAQAPARGRADQARLPRRRPRPGHRGREAGLRHRLPQRGRQGGHRRLPRQAHPEVERQVASDASPEVARLAELIRESRCTVALTGAGVSVPSGIPDFRTPETGLWANVDPMEVAHIDVFERDPARFWSYYRPRFHSLGDKRPNAAHEALAELERRGLLEGVITQNIDRLHRAAGSRERGRGARLDRDLDLPELRRLLRRSSEVDALFDEDGVADLRGLRRAGQARRRPLRRDAAGERRCAQAQQLAAAGRADALHRLLARRLPGRRPAGADPRARRPAGDRHQGRRRPMTATPS